MVEIIEFLNRVSLPFVFGFLFSISVVLINLLHVFMYESLNPIKKFLNSFLVVLAYLALSFSLVLEYNYVLIINQFTKFILDPKFTIYYITFLNVFFYVIHFKVISENLVKNEFHKKLSFYVNYGVLILVLAFTFLGDETYFMSFIILFITLLVINFIIWLKEFKDKKMAIITFVTTLLGFVFFIFKSGYLFGFGLSSFYLVYLFNYYKWLVFSIYPILLGINLVYYNHLIIESYKKDEDKKNRLNSTFYNKDKLKERGLYL
jgi:hypothetical protein